MSYYNTLIPDDKAVFLKTLASQYSVDHSVVLHLAKTLEAAHVSQNKNWAMKQPDFGGKPWKNREH